MIKIMVKKQNKPTISKARKVYVYVMIGVVVAIIVVGIVLAILRSIKLGSM